MLDEFQSLIGRLKTKQFDEQHLRLLRFQSLIGRLKTITSDMFERHEIEFQSLIGRLKTRDARSVIQARFMRVSIPHR